MLQADGIGAGLLEYKMSQVEALSDEGFCERLPELLVAIEKHAAASLHWCFPIPRKKELSLVEKAVWLLGNVWADHSGKALEKEAIKLASSGEEGCQRLVAVTLLAAGYGTGSTYARQFSSNTALQQAKDAVEHAWKFSDKGKLKAWLDAGGRYALTAAACMFSSLIRVLSSIPRSRSCPGMLMLCLICLPCQLSQKRIVVKLIIDLLFS